MFDKPVITGDGSITYRNAETGELYHNSAGAYTEAMTTYVRPSCAVERMRQNREIRVLDVCFGFGYNSWALIETLLNEVEGPFKLEITAIEKDPEAIRKAFEILESGQFPRLSQLMKNAKIL